MATTNSATPPRCQVCGTALTALSANPGEAPLCPACLLGLGLQPAAETLDWSPDSPAGGGDVGDRVPDVAQLMQYFPNLEIQHLIGYGGMGAVYQARQPHLDRTVALKILSPRLSRNEAFAQRFMREARTLAKLAHPNIVMVFEFGQAGPLHYLILEFVDGVNLRDAMLEGQLTTVEALAIVPQLCDALQYAHDEGVVHRDIKPENILLDKRGRVKIADFGLAKLMQPPSEERRLTGTRQVLGTLNYMAPEQIEGRNQIDHRADIYSLGVVFYELLTGELPLGRFAVPSEKARVDARLDQVVLRTLEKEPQRRYQQASQVKSAMQDLSVVEAQGIDPLAAPVNLATGYSPANGLPPLGPPPQVAAPQPQPKPEPSAQAAPWAGMGVNAFNQSPGSLPVPLPAVPFTIDNVNWGFGVATGLIKTTPVGLSVEFEVLESFFQNRIQAPKTVVLPWSSISTAKYQEGLLRDTLTVQATSIAAAADIPAANGGSFSLSIKRSDRRDGRLLTTDIQHHLSVGRQGLDGRVIPQSWQSLAHNPAWLGGLRNSLDYALQFVPSFWADRPINTIRVTARFTTAQFWFVTCGVLNFIFLSSKMRRMARDLVEPMIDVTSSSAAYPLSQFLKNADTVINPFSSHFGNGYFTWSIIFSILLFTLSERLQQLRSYNYIVLVCAIALIPFYPTYILCAPWALTVLVLLLFPSSLAAFDQVDENGKIRWDGPPLGKSEPSLGDLMSHDPLRFVARMAMVGGVLGSLLLVGLYFLNVPSFVYESSSSSRMRPQVQVSGDGHSSVEEPQGTTAADAAVAAPAEEGPQTQSADDSPPPAETPPVDTPPVDTPPVDTPPVDTPSPKSAEPPKPADARKAD